MQIDHPGSQVFISRTVGPCGHEPPVDLQLLLSAQGRPALASNGPVLFTTPPYASEAFPWSTLRGVGTCPTEKWQVGEAQHGVSSLRQKQRQESQLRQPGAWAQVLPLGAASHSCLRAPDNNSGISFYFTMHGHERKCLSEQRKYPESSGQMEYNSYVLLVAGCQGKWSLVTH